MNILSNLKKWIKVKFLFDDNEQKDQDILEYKILVVGERIVGKSSICMRFTMNEFNLEIKPTTQCECYTKSIKLYDQMIKIYLIDVDSNVMSNDHAYLYSEVKGVLCVYDVTKMKTFERIDNWIHDIRQNVGNSLPMLLAGNKTDLKFLRNVEYEEGVDKANALNCEFVETSCVDASSVKEAIKLLIAKIYYQDLPESKKNYFKIIISNTNASAQSSDEANLGGNSDQPSEQEEGPFINQNSNSQSISITNSIQKS